MVSSGVYGCLEKGDHGATSRVLIRRNPVKRVTTDREIF